MPEPITAEDLAHRATGRRCVPEDLEERASELEFVNGLPRDLAEKLARAQCGCGGGKQFSEAVAAPQGRALRVAR